MVRASQILIVLGIATGGCVEPYFPPVVSSDVDLLVVDGFLNASTQSATVKLSHAALLTEGSTTSEAGASVVIEGDDGSRFSLHESDSGNYLLDNIPVNHDAHYRLRIDTQRIGSYVSGFVPVLHAPSIDSVNWHHVKDGITFYVNSHDLENATQYYSWDYVETWEYTTSFYTSYTYIDGKPVPRQPEDQIYWCWRTQNSKKSLVGSTARLSDAVVHEFPLLAIDGPSQKLSRRYSLLVRQRALTKEAYDFWSQLEKSSESLGGLFDPLPSQLKGNVSGVVENEPVLGYFSAGTVSEHRMFLKFEDLPDAIRAVRAQTPCTDVDKIYMSNQQVIDGGNSAYLLEPVSIFGIIVGYLTSTARCADCRAQGGVSQQPEFW